MKIIAKHLDRKNLKCKIHTVDTICAFNGEHITEGVAIKELVSDVFTDWAYIRHKSDFCSVDMAMCVADVVPGKTRNNSLRNYSYFASENELKMLDRGDMLELLLNIPSTPFRVALTYNHKKHTTYKTVLNANRETFIIATDLTNVLFEVEKVKTFLPVIQKWYTVIPEKSTTAAQPTFFTKDEIMGAIPQYKKVVEYGLELFEQENEFLVPFRNTNLFQLVVHLINKKTNA